MDDNRIEGLLTEFYTSTNLSNERVQEISKLLDEYGSHPQSLTASLRLIDTSGNDFVHMYALSIIEHAVQKRWSNLTPTEREKIKSSLSAACANSSAPAFLRNKYVKILVDIGKFTWPAEYPDFLENILRLCFDSHNALLGILFLKSTVDEFSSNRENVTFERKKELLHNFIQYVPRVSNLLKDVLEAIAQSQPTDTPPTYTDERKAMLSLALQTLTQLVQWIPSTSWLSPEVTGIIFRFIPVVEDQNVQATCARYAVASDAMSVINEILSKKYSSEADVLLNLVIQNGFHLLEGLLTPLPSGESRIGEIDEGYLSKFTDFVFVFVQNHLLRFLHMTGFNVESFFFLLYKFTEQQTSTDGFISTLDFWEIILAIFTTKVQEKGSNKEELLSRFEPVFLAVCDMLLKKIQMAYNEEQIEMMLDDVTEEGQESVWQIFLKNDIEILFGIAILYEEKVTTLVEDVLTSLCKTYMAFESKYVTTSAQGVQGAKPLVNPLSDEELSSIAYATQDLTSFLQLTGRFSALFTEDETFAERKSSGLSLFTTALEAASFGSTARLYVPFGMIDYLRRPLVLLHAESLGCLRAWCSWLALYQSCSSPDSITVKHLVQSYISACTPVLSPDSPKAVVKASANSLATATALLRSKFLSEMPEVGQLFDEVGRLRSFHFESYILVTRSLFNILILPWHNVPAKEQRMEERGQRLEALIQYVCQDFIAFVRTPGVETNAELLKRGKKVTEVTLHLLGELIVSIANEGTPVKVRVFDVIKSFINDAKVLAMAYSTASVDLGVLNKIVLFFSHCFECLQQQMGFLVCSEIIQTLIAVLVTMPFGDAVRFDAFLDGHGSAIIECVMTILEFAVRGASKEYKKLLPSALTLCLDNIYPAVAQRSSPEVKVKLLTLLGVALMYQWRYFFPSGESLENPDVFYKIMAAFGQAFLQPDMQVFKESLRVLTELNSKWNLFHKEIFRSKMLSQFLTVLLQVLISKSHDLLRDEIAQAMYDLASVDFQAFFCHFLPEFSTTLNGLSEEQRVRLVTSFKHEMDFPTFTMNLERFLIDSRCFFISQHS